MEKSPLIIGFVLQSSMILALGAQNLFVLEKGLKKEHSTLIAFICSVCDISLIMLGVLGAGSFFAGNEGLTMLLKIVGASFLLRYAWVKFHEASVPLSANESSSKSKAGLKAVIMSTLGVSLLNPHVYLDTVVLLGGYSTQFGSVQERLSFAVGAGLLSAIWFFSLSFGAGLFSKKLNQPATMKKLNYFSSALMVCLGVNLAWSVVF
jgi:L-lysine exporter family protein LysE/ArgO